MKKTILILAIATLFATGLTTQAFAAKSNTKSYKVSVTLPSTVGIYAYEKLSKGKLITNVDWRKNLVETVIVRNNVRIFLRTIVVQ